MVDSVAMGGPTEAVIKDEAVEEGSDGPLLDAATLEFSVILLT